jgi:hypothetical protein
MNQLIKSLSAATALATAAVIVTEFVPNHAVAQQKPPATPTLVASIYEPGFNPYQTSHGTFFAVNTVSITESLPIPTGKIAVVEHVSASGALSTGAVPRGFVECFNGNQQVSHSLVFFSQGNLNGLTMWAASQPIKCYATGNGLDVHIQTNAFQTAQPSWLVAASGYTVQ